jgi:hypothetical protein
MSETEIELKKSVDVIINNIKTSKIILMNEMDKIVNEYRKFHLKNIKYSMIDAPFKYGGKYKYTNIDISNIVGDYVNIKIEDFYNPIKLPKYGNISTICHLNMFHFTNPIIPYTNINYDLQFKKPTTQENTQISRYLIDKLSELHKALANTQITNIINTSIIIFDSNKTSPIIIDLTNLNSFLYYIIIFDNINNNNITIKTSCPITIISYNSNINLRFTYVNPLNTNCPIQEKITCPIQEKITCPIQEKITCPIQEKITCLIQEKITCPIQEKITCPIQEKINYFDNTYILILLLFFIILTILLTIKLTI